MFQQFLDQLTLHLGENTRCLAVDNFLECRFYTFALQCYLSSANPQNLPILCSGNSVDRELNIPRLPNKRSRQGYKRSLAIRVKTLGPDLPYVAQ
jgi:hypothetical protein